MKATVMESKNGKSVILTEDGMFRTVNGKYDVGYEFDYKESLRTNRKMTSRIAAAAACLFMMLSMGTYSYQNLMVYATVTLHGETPIQLEVNRKDKVIGVKAVDESGEALAEQLLDSGIKGEYVGDAVAKAEQLMAKGATDKDKKQEAVAPQVQCKSSDKMKDLTNKLRPKTKSTTAAPTQGATREETTSTAAPQAADSQDVSAQGDDSAPTTVVPSAEPATEPSSEEGVSSQEEPTDLTPQEDAGDMEAQEDPGEMGAQEAPADPEPVVEKEPADMGAQEAPTDAGEIE